MASNKKTFSGQVDENLIVMRAAAVAGQEEKNLSLSSIVLLSIATAVVAKTKPQ